MSITDSGLFELTFSSNDEHRVRALARIQKDDQDWAGLKQTALGRMRESDQPLKGQKGDIGHGTGTK